MVQKVEKRDGRIVDFDHNLICLAICKAMNECEIDDKEIAYQLALEVRNSSDKECLTVDEIQVMVENLLMKTDQSN